MNLRNLNFSLLLVAALLVSGVCLSSAEAQTRSRKRTSSKSSAKPVVTNPKIAPSNEEEAPADEPKVVRTAD